MFRTILAAATVAVLSAGAFAQTSTPRVDARQQNQAQRIEQGTASGALTQREGQRLEQGQQRVERMERHAAADGTVTHRERYALAQAQDAQSARIARQKHDRQHDFNHNGRVDRPRRR